MHWHGPVLELTRIERLGPDVMDDPPDLDAMVARFRPACGTPVQSRPQGDDARTAYWCPVCQSSATGC